MKIVYRGVTGVPLHCVRFYGVTTLAIGSAEELFLVFDLATGGSIDEYLDRFGVDLGWNDVLQLFYDIASGLHELHSRGIAHG